MESCHEMTLPTIKKERCFQLLLITSVKYDYYVYVQHTHCILRQVSVIHWGRIADEMGGPRSQLTSSSKELSWFNLD